MGFSKTGYGSNLDADNGTRIALLENEQVTEILFATYVAGTTTGSIPTAPGVTIEAGFFGLSGDLLLSKINAQNYPTGESPTDALSNVVTASFSASPTWVTSSVPLQNYALIVALSGTRKSLNEWKVLNPTWKVWFQAHELEPGVTIGTSGQVPIVNSTNDDFTYTNNFFFDEVNGRLGINDNSPSYPLSVRSVSTYNASTNYSALGSIDIVGRFVGGPSSRVVIESFSNIGNAGAPGIVFRRTNGSYGTPTATLSGDFIGGFNYSAYRATAYSPSAAAISVVATENWTDALTGTRIVFNTTDRATGVSRVVANFGLDAAITTSSGSRTITQDFGVYTGGVNNVLRGGEAHFETIRVGENFGASNYLVAVDSSAVGIVRLGQGSTVTQITTSASTGEVNVLRGTVFSGTKSFSINTNQIITGDTSNYQTSITSASNGITGGFLNISRDLGGSGEKFSALNSLMKGSGSNRKAAASHVSVTTGGMSIGMHAASVGNNGANPKIGVLGFNSSNGSFTSYTVGTAAGNLRNAWSIGVAGFATEPLANKDVNIGVYGYAEGETDNYAGYFEGFTVLQVPYRFVAVNSTVVKESNTTIEQTASGITTTLWASPLIGDIIRIANVSAGNNTIAGNGLNIEGAASITILSGERFTLIYNGTQWRLY